MIRRSASRIAAAAVVVVVVAFLTACTGGSPEGGRKWLGEQSGIIATSVVSETHEELLTTGIVRGELKPGLSASDLQTLVDTVGGYQAKHANVSFELGLHDVDFAISDRVTNKREIGLWRVALKAKKAINGLVSSSDGEDKVSLTTLRPDAIAALTTIGGLKAELRIDAYATRDEAVNGATDDRDLVVDVPADCHPADPDWAFAQTVPTRTDVQAANLALCDSLKLVAPPDASLATIAPALRAELDSTGVTLPVRLVSQPANVSYARSIAVLPGVPSAFGVLAAAEKPDLRYDLAEDGTLTLRDAAQPVDALISLLKATPGADALPELDLYGSDVAVGGPLAALPALRETALALDAASDTFGEVELTPAFGSVELEGTISDPPHVADAAAALRASGVTQGRTFAVTYVAFQVDIQDGIATLHDHYTDPHIAQSFVDAWNAG